MNVLLERKKAQIQESRRYWVFMRYRRTCNLKKQKEPKDKHRNNLTFIKVYISYFYLATM